MPYQTNQPEPASTDADEQQNARTEPQCTETGSADTHHHNNGHEDKPAGLPTRPQKQQLSPTPPPRPRSKYFKVLKKDRPIAWLVLLGLLLLGSIPIYTYLHAGPISQRQADVLIPAEQTWRNRHTFYQGDVNLESIVPIVDGEPQLQRPPGDIWLYQIAFASLDPLTATQEQLAENMRLLSAFFGLLTIAAIFWAGFSIGGIKTASFSALIALSCPLFTWYARQGTPDIPLIGFHTLAIASAMWALRPLKPTPTVWRQAIGWIICGAALGAAILIGGLSALPIVILPILITAIMCPNRISHVLGLIAAICIAGLMVIPWALSVHQQDTTIWQHWVLDLWPQRMQNLPAIWDSITERSLLVLVLALPWTFWLIGAYAQPFSASSSGVRRRVFIGWAWLTCVGVLAVLGLSPTGMPGMVIMLPAATILIGQALRLYSDRSAEGRHARVWRHIRWAHMIFMILASIAIPLGLLFQEELVDQGWFDMPIAAPVAWYFSLGLGISLLLITIMSMRYALRHYPGKATIWWSIWSVVLMSVTLIPISRGPWMNPAPDQPDTNTQEVVTIPAE